MKKIILFGSSGSIGTQTIEVLKRLKNQFELTAISIGQNDSFLESVLKEFPTIKKVYSTKELKIKNEYKNIEFINDDILKLFEPNVDYVVNALSGFYGLQVTIKSIEENKTLLLANKESLVTGGNLVNKLLVKHPLAKLYPIDSEHCAIWQCLEENNTAKSLILTASGGPFRDLSLDQTKDVTLEQALKHPNWSMGYKITIDSATMFNKAFEILEAYHLFKIKNIQVLVHPQSIIHSMVEFDDFSIKAQLSVPDMKNVISYFLNYPNRVEMDNFKRMNFNEMISLDLKLIDQNRFTPVKMAMKCLELKNSKSIALNAANEVCVENFVNKKIKFYEITQIIERIFTEVENIELEDFDSIKEFDQKVRDMTLDMIGA